MSTWSHWVAKVLKDLLELLLCKCWNGMRCTDIDHLTTSLEWCPMFRLTCVVLFLWDWQFSLVIVLVSEHAAWLDASFLLAFASVCFLCLRKCSCQCCHPCFTIKHIVYTYRILKLLSFIYIAILFFFYSAFTYTSTIFLPRKKKQNILYLFKNRKNIHSQPWLEGWIIEARIKP